MGERAPPFPERIGRYDVLLPIASGGMGTVYLARATSIGGFEREVALKLMHAHLKDNGSFASDLVEEAKLTVRVRHPNVVSVIDVGEDPFGIYLVMEYVEGDTLAGLHKRSIASPEKNLPVRYGLKLLLDALTGLHAAHELKDEAGNPTGLVHRDFSPQNILVGVDGIGRLTDFGIAKAATRISDTTTGIIKGKIAYMAPEQARGATIDRRTDIWAAGVVAWQIIAGKRLYAGQENEVATLLKIASQPPPRLRDVKPDVHPLMDEAVARALTMEPEQRWPTAQAFKQALQNACRVHSETADTDEVASFVSGVVQSVVTERRARVGEILRLRAKVEKLATRTDVGASTSTPSAEIVAVDPVTVVAKTHDEDTSAATVPLQRVELDATRTDATSVTESTAPAKRTASRWTPLVYGAAGVVITSCFFLALSLRSRGTRDAVPPPPSVTTAAALASVVESVSAGTSVAEARPPVTASARPMVHEASTVVATRPRAAKPATSTSAESLLPRSPYETNP